MARKFVYNEAWAGLRRCWEMTDLLHNRELVVWWLSVMTSFYAAMKCCTVGSWKSGSASKYLLVSLNVEYRQIRDRSVRIIRSVMEDSVSWFCAVEKWICFCLGQRWKSLLANSRPRSEILLPRKCCEPGLILSSTGIAIGKSRVFSAADYKKYWRNRWMTLTQKCIL